MNHSLRSFAISLPALALVLAACGGDKPPASAPIAKGPEGHIAIATTSNAVVPKKDPDAVNISDEIKRVCGIDSQSAAPKFDFDKASLMLEGRETLQKLANCLTVGALKGRRVLLTGHTDPRGTNDYNMALGAQRANTVHAFLGSLGVGDGSLQLSSRGELDAEGTEESSWARDRRVDISLAK